MDSDGSQRDFMSNFFQMEQQNSHHHHQQQGLDSNQQQQQQMFGYNSQSQGAQQSTSFGIQMPMNTMDLLGNMLNMQGMQGIETQSNSGSASFSPQALLEQQVKLNQLQQLQQLQNQILQTQIALISSQTAGLMAHSPVVGSQREQNQFNGLPTPGPSGDIAPRHTIEPPPMLLNGNDFQQSDMNFPVSPMEAYPHSSRFPGSTSAPEHVAFAPLNTSHVPDLNLDVSPMTSPGLHATSHSHNKRNASSSGDESLEQRAKKRQSPAIRPINPGPTRRHTRGTKSAGSTPLFQSTRSSSRRGSIVGESPGDSPSPVDLSSMSMPPPAAPASASHHTSSPSNSMTSSPAFNPQIMPVTPGSIMNLGRLGSRNTSSASTSRNTGVAQPPMGTTVQFNVEPTKSKNSAPSTPKLTATGEPARRTSTRKSSTGGSNLVSPALKAIRPAGSTPTLSATQSTTSTPILAPLPDPVIRKSSHKVAEQKRRDSLKAKYDELRVLLPPIALPNDERYADEPVLPGALPPRGPPKAGQEGPNKAVSKLQLLMCGNEYIRQLKGRVDRRDEEIDKLRGEIRRLRIVLEQAGIQDGFGAEEPIDLDKDIDAVEASRFSNGVNTILEEEDGDEDD